MMLIEESLRLWVAAREIVKGFQEPFTPWQKDFVITLVDYEKFLFEGTNQFLTAENFANEQDAAIALENCKKYFQFLLSELTRSSQLSVPPFSASSCSSLSQGTLIELYKNGMGLFIDKISRTLDQELDLSKLFDDANVDPTFGAVISEWREEYYNYTLEDEPICVVNLKNKIALDNRKSSLQCLDPISRVKKSYTLSQDSWVLSILRTIEGDKNQHATLLLEGADENEHYVVYRAHLVTYDQVHAQIISEKITPDYVEYAFAEQNRTGYMFPITAEKARIVLRLIEAEVARSARKEIPFIKTGKTPGTGILGKSLISMGSGTSQAKSAAFADDINTRREENYTGFFKASTMASKEAIKQSLRKLLNPEGHNCMSWVKAMAAAVDCRVPKSAFALFFVDPRRELVPPKTLSH